MEVRLSFFLFLIFVQVVINAFLIYFGYRAFASITGKLTNAMQEIEDNNTMREWIESFRNASEQAVSVTELTKQRIAGFNPQMDNFQARFEFLLAQVDSRIERIARDISENATRVRDAVSEPAEKFAATAAGIQSVLSFVSPGVDSMEDDQ